MDVTLKHHWEGKLLLALVALFTSWWVAIQLTGGQNSHLYVEIFTGTYGFVALFGGLWGVRIANRWGGLKSYMGRSILMFSLGLLAQEFGQIAYFFYIYVLKVDVPYPSIGDIGYVSTIVFYILGIYYLARVAGTPLSLKNFRRKIELVVVPLFILGFAYMLFLKGYQFDFTKPLTIVLDFGYPLGDAVYVSLTIMTFFLCKSVLGGIMRNKILFILFALVLQFLSDYTFLYQAHRDIWYPGGINDYLYLLSYAAMAFGILQLNTVLVKLKEKA